MFVCVWSLQPCYSAILLNRLIVTSDGKRQLYYLDGSNIGATSKAVNAPIEMIGKPLFFVIWHTSRHIPSLSSTGNRVCKEKGLKNSAIGAIARLKIYNHKLSEAAVKEMCGAVDKSEIQIDRDPTWERHSL